MKEKFLNKLRSKLGNQKQQKAAAITVISGVHKLKLNLKGKKVKEVKNKLQKPLNISDEATVVVNGKEKSNSYILQEGDALEFVKKSGSKG